MDRAADDLSGLEDEVFRTPPKQFTAARDALVAALKAAGRNDEAKAAKTWRRPAVPVWLWNRLYLDGDDSAREALASASSLGSAIAAGGTELGDDIAALREAISRLVARAREVAAGADVTLSTAQERELVELVQALPWSQSAREEAARGRLHEPPPPVDPLEAMRVAGGHPAPAPKPKAQPAENAALVKAEAVLVKAEAALAEATAAHATAKRAEEQARARAEMLLKEAHERVATAASDEEAAREAVTEARRHRDAIRRVP